MAKTKIFAAGGCAAQTPGEAEARGPGRKSVYYGVYTWQLFPPLAVDSTEPEGRGPSKAIRGMNLRRIVYSKHGHRISFLRNPFLCLTSWR
jgi:hypothetical protein